MSCCKEHHPSHSHPEDVKSKNSQEKASGCCSSYNPYEEQQGGCCSTESKGGCCGSSTSYEDECPEEAPEHIHAQMTIQELLSNFPAHSQRLAQELTQIGLQCVGCQASVYETIEAGMKRHGMDDRAIEKLLNTLNSILEENSDPTTVTLTPRAAKKYLSILEAEEKEGWGLRFADKPAGCSGFEYVLDYSEKANPEDKVYMSEGIEIHVHRGSITRLEGALIDYVDGLHASGFKISNSKARSSCGCGSSHNY